MDAVPQEWPWLRITKRFQTQLVVQPSTKSLKHSLFLKSG